MIKSVAGWTGKRIGHGKLPDEYYLYEYLTNIAKLLIYDIMLETLPSTLSELTARHAANSAL